MMQLIRPPVRCRFQDDLPSEGFARRSGQEILAEPPSRRAAANL